jgi:DNA mismatch repair protein MutS
MGDFYETFFEDAIEAARILDLTLTSRNKDDPNPIPMAGVPHHAAPGYIARLIEAGRKVAICEQMEDPRQAKGIVRREVVRVITPGVLLDTELADSSQANHLVCAVSDERGWSIAALDASTGVLSGAFVTEREDLPRILGRLVVREVLLPDGTDDHLRVLLCATGALATGIPAADMEAGSLPKGSSAVLPAEPAPSSLVRAATALLAYLGRTHKALLDTVQPFERLAVAETMFLPQTTIRNLELLSSTASGRPSGSLFHHLNRTRTPMGARELRARLLAPLIDPGAIDRRLDQVAAFHDEPALRTQVRDALAGVPDVERLLTRLAAGSASARDLNATARAITALESIASMLSASDLPALSNMAVMSPALPPVAKGIETTFVDDPPPAIRDGGMIRRGIRSDLDEAMDMAGNGRQYIARYEAAERERTGIPTLKIRYNRVFGYTIEVTRSQSDKVPDNYQRRQTLTGAERFTTRELSDLEATVASADERSRTLQVEVFEEWRGRVLDKRSELQELARSLAGIDVACCLAELAHHSGWCRPGMTLGRGLRMLDARHPIVEHSLPTGTFVPNDFVLDGERETLTILTGPNMAGKSTVMRQVAICVLLAQTGSFVPAREAEIGVADAIFTRVGAMDDLAAGRSTFMVEMSEAAEMLARATDRSLVILDEIGRGTSTFDGVAIAWSVAEHIQYRIGCRTLFATHYHELTDLVRSVPRARNQSIAVKEWGGEVLFLRKLVDGPASKSYGIQVARLAGLPDEVIQRAKEVLSNLEAAELDAVGRPLLARAGGGGRSGVRSAGQMELFAAVTEPEPDPLLEELATVDVDRVTPMEALQLLADLVARARKGRKSAAH